METEEYAAPKRKEELPEGQMAANSPTTTFAKAVAQPFLSRLSPDEDAADEPTGQRYVETSDISESEAPKESPGSLKPMPLYRDSRRSRSRNKIDDGASGAEEDQAAHVSAQASSSSGLGIPTPEKTFATPLPPKERGDRNQRNVKFAESPRNVVMHLDVNLDPPAGAHAKCSPLPLWHFSFRDTALNKPPGTCPTVSEVQQQIFKSVRISLSRRRRQTDIHD